MVKLVDLKCTNCNKPFVKEQRFITRNIKITKGKWKPFCCQQCSATYRNIRQELSCTNCGNLCVKRQVDLRRGFKHSFCSLQCRTIYSNKERIQNGYTTRNKTKNVICSVCKDLVNVSIHAANKTFCCNKCKPKAEHTLKIKHKPKSKIEHKCALCCINDVTYSGHSNYNKYCVTCLPIAQQNAGLKSASSRKDTKRSKNEIYLGELCETVYKNITYNEPMFNKWDSDIQLHDYKLAIHWNGLWHYQYCGGKHSVKQVQSRDKIKHKEIENCGWTNYIIKDMGKFNKEFVENEFTKLVEMISRLEITQ